MSITLWNIAVIGCTCLLLAWPIGTIAGGDFSIEQLKKLNVMNGKTPKEDMSGIRVGFEGTAAVVEPKSASQAASQMVVHVNVGYVGEAAASTRYDDGPKFMTNFKTPQLFIVTLTPDASKGLVAKTSAKDQNAIAAAAVSALENKLTEAVTYFELLVNKRVEQMARKALYGNL